jgi:hypothetical protein
MLVCHDLICDCGHVSHDHRHQRGTLPPCPHHVDGEPCGAPTQITWAHTSTLNTRFKAPGIGGYKPITYDGVTYETQAQWDAKIKAIEDNTGLTAHVVSDNAAQRSSRANDAHHRAWSTRKRAGICTQQLEERRADVKRQKNPTKN